MIARLFLLAVAIVVQPLADEDILEPSVANEVDHARALLPTNALPAPTPRAFALIGTNGLSRTALAIRLVSLQRPDGRFFVGTNDVTSAAAPLLRIISD